MKIETLQKFIKSTMTSSQNEDERAALQRYYTILGTVHHFLNSNKVNHLQDKLRRVRQESVDFSNRFYLMKARISAIESTVNGHVSKLEVEHKKCEEGKVLGISRRILGRRHGKQDINAEAGAEVTKAAPFINNYTPSLQF